MSQAKPTTFADVVGPDMAERIAAIANDPHHAAEARRLEVERKDAERLARNRELAAAATQALRGDWGKEAKESVERTLGGMDPLRATVAELVQCESVVREAKMRKRKSKRGRGTR